MTLVESPHTPSSRIRLSDAGGEVSGRKLAEQAGSGGLAAGIQQGGPRLWRCFGLRDLPCMAGCMRKPLPPKKSYYNIRYNLWSYRIMVKLKLTTVGSSTGVVLPKEVLARLKVQKGDTLFLTDSPDGYRITPYDPEFEQQMELARRVMRERRNVLKELAK
jgi:putative addiction module antidote